MSTVIAKSMIISDVCRKNKTDVGAAGKACGDVMKELLTLMQVHVKGNNTKFTVQLIMEKPDA